MTDQLIRIIDDEEEVRDSLGLLLECAGHTIASYDSAEDFLTKDNLTIPCCILSDIRMPGMSGLELQAEMIRRHITLPLIFITGHGDIEMAADAILAGAYDFLVKPVKEERLFAAMDRALAVFDQQTDEVYRERIGKLTDREREVLRLTLDGVSTHAIAERLVIGERTVQGHRWRLYQKIGLNSTELLREKIHRNWC